MNNAEEIITRTWHGNEFYL